VKDKETKILILSVFIAGSCSIIYELLIATATSYFLGDSIKQFSITIGAYMAAMGVGSYFSRLISDKNLLIKFISFELLLGLVGGLSVPLLYASFAYTGYFQTSSILLTIVIGILIGLEIPILSRLLEKYYSLKINISTVLSVDYFGALIATIIFPFLLLPVLGTFKASIFFGLLNMSIAVILLWAFSEVISFSKKKILWLHTTFVTLLLGTTFMLSNTLLSEWSNSLYTDRIVFAKETPYQNIVITKHKEDVRLYLNGNLQFSSSDEYRYHEALVHVPMNYVEQPENVLVLGGGDGLGVREILKHSSVKNITLIDLDPEITRLGSENKNVLRINKGSMNNSKLKIQNDDAFKYLISSNELYDVIIIDLPDPNNPSLARLYSREFYKLVKQHLTQKGIFVTQATSPFFSRDAFWTIFSSVKSSKISNVIAYHVNVPSFGEWGFVLGTNQIFDRNKWNLNIPTRYIDESVLQKLWIFGKDIAYKQFEPSTIDQPRVLDLYLRGWTYWN